MKAMYSVYDRTGDCFDFCDDDETEHSLDYDAEHERIAVIETIDELMGMESDRHPMFSEGYDYALDHIKRFVQGRRKK